MTAGKQSLGMEVEGDATSAQRSHMELSFGAVN